MPENLSWPVIGGSITDVMGSKRPYGSHEGIDIAPTGGKLTALSAQTGVVIKTGFMPAGYGNYIVIRAPDGVETLYGHLNSIGVRTGQSVRAGQPIGIIGSTGYSTGTHLHFSVIEKGKFINPFSSAIRFTNNPFINPAPPQQQLPQQPPQAPTGSIPTGRVTSGYVVPIVPIPQIPKPKRSKLPWQSALDFLHSQFTTMQTPNINTATGEVIQVEHGVTTHINPTTPAGVSSAIDESKKILSHDIEQAANKVTSNVISSTEEEFKRLAPELIGGSLGLLFIAAGIGAIAKNVA